MPLNINADCVVKAEGVSEGKKPISFAHERKEILIPPILSFKCWIVDAQNEQVFPL